jgi:hypothetical protein
MALAANFQASFVGQLSGMDDISFGLGRLDMLGAWAMTFFTPNIEFHVFGLIP